MNHLSALLVFALLAVTALSQDVPCASQDDCDAIPGCDATYTCTASICVSDETVRDDGVDCVVDSDNFGCSTLNGTCDTGTCLPAPLNEGEDCADPDNDCTRGTCVSGTCDTESLLAGDACDDHDECTSNSTCVDGEDGTVCTATEGSETVCDSPSDVCEESEGTCNPVSGECEYPFLANGTECEGVSNCSSSTCQDGVCTVEEDSDTCEDPEDQCEVASCTEEGCVTEVDTGATCDDDDVCTFNDTCDSEGDCAGTPKSCATNGHCNPEAPNEACIFPCTLYGCRYGSIDTCSSDSWNSRTCSCGDSDVAGRNVSSLDLDNGEWGFPGCDGDDISPDDVVADIIANPTALLNFLESTADLNGVEDFAIAANGDNNDEFRLTYTITNADDVNDVEDTLDGVLSEFLGADLNLNLVNSKRQNGSYTTVVQITSVHQGSGSLLVPSLLSLLAVAAALQY